MDEGVFLGGRGASNWYHFLVEILPRLHLLRHDLPERFQHLPLLIPEATLASRAARELVSLLAPDAEVVPLTNEAMIRVERLLWIDVPVHSAYKLDRWVDIRPDHEAIDIQFFREYRAGILALAGIVPRRESGALLFLDRGPQDARPYNRDDVLPMVKALGFSPIDLGTYGAVEQISAAAGASVLVGPHGAAWSSLLFVDPSARALTLTPRLPRVAGFSGFQNLAAVSGARLRDLPCPAAGNNWSVDVDALGDALEALLGDGSGW